MSKPIAITGNLVNIRNIDKCVALTIHLPRERSAEIVAAFGWPTMVARTALEEAP